MFPKYFLFLKLDFKWPSMQSIYDKKCVRYQLEKCLTSSLLLKSKKCASHLYIGHMPSLDGGSLEITLTVPLTTVEIKAKPKIRITFKMLDLK